MELNHGVVGIIFAIAWNYWFAMIFADVGADPITMINGKCYNILKEILRKTKWKGLMKKSSSHPGIVILLFFCLLFTLENGNCAWQLENKKVSFDFDKCSISDALREIGKKTGIDISINKTMDKTLLSRSYRNCSIGEIIRDMFSNQNHVIGFYPSYDRPESIQIWILDNEGLGKAAALERPPNKKPLGTALTENKPDTPAENKPLDKKEETYTSFPGKIFRDSSNAAMKTEYSLPRNINSKRVPIPPQQEGQLPPAIRQKITIESPPLPPAFHQ